MTLPDCSLPPTVATLRELVAGVPLDTPRVEMPPPLDREARVALQQALRVLSIRGYPTEELRRRLLRTHGPQAVEAALATLASSPFLDDARWAAGFVSSARGRQRSSGLLRRELSARGVTVEDARAALESHDDAEAALVAARRRWGALAHLEPAIRERRLRDYLARRGFGSNVIGRALGELVADRTMDAT
ncbi:MAG: regulatory protein RecX [Dehalococcoidia bacterium]